MDPSLDTAAAEKVIDVLYCIGPTMFMFCMGASFVLTRHDSAEDFLKRGIELIVLFFVLNIFRFTIPGVFGGLIINDQELIFIGAVWTFASDILMFAGLTFLAMYLVKRFSVKPILFVAVAAVLCILQGFIPGVSVGDGLTENIGAMVLGYFYFAGQDFSIFPFMGWLIFPAAGYWYGVHILGSEDTVERHRIVASISLIVSAAIVIGATFGLYGFDFLWWAGSGYDISPLSALFCASLCLFVASILYMVLRGVTVRDDGAIISVSRNITGIYCVQWLMIMWLIIVPAYASDILATNLPILFLLGVIVFFASYYVCILIGMRTGKKRVL